jgi:hypothetical protein
MRWLWNVFSIECIPQRSGGQGILVRAPTRWRDPALCHARVPSAEVFIHHPSRAPHRGRILKLIENTFYSGMSPAYRMRRHNL